MANAEIQSYKRVERNQDGEMKKEKYVPKIELDEFIIGVISFLISRVSIANGLSPFGAAFFAAGYRLERKSVFSFFGATLGVLTLSQGADALKYIASMLLFAALKIPIKKDGLYTNAMLAGAALFVCGFIKTLAGYMLTYDLLILTLEAFVCLFFVVAFDAATSYINNKMFFSYISNEQLLSLTFVLALSLSGIGKTVAIGYLNFCEIACSVIIMVLAMQRGGAFGACAGVVSGIVCAIGKDAIMNSVGIYALCGFFGGCVKNLGRGGVCAGFLLSGACSGFLTSTAMFEGANLINMIIGGVIFLSVPMKTLDKARMFTEGIYVEPEDVLYMKKASEYIQGRIKSLIRSYENLSEATRVQAVEENFERNVEKAVNSAVLKVCSRCGMKNMCIEKDSGVPKLLFEGELKLFEQGGDGGGEFPEKFIKNCINFKDFSSCVNHFYSLSRANELWQKQILSSRQLVSTQYLEFSKTLNKLRLELAKELAGEKYDEKKLETKIFSELCKMNLAPVNVCVRDADKGYYNVFIKFMEKSYNSYRNEIMQLVSDVFGIDMNIVNTNESKEENTLFLEPIYRYLPICASATVRKDKNGENGDNIIKENMSKSRFFMSVSDGMGSGHEAAMQSRKANAMFLTLLDAQYDMAQAIKLVNSALASQGGEVFTTVDMSVVDLMDGVVEFVKIGAMPSIIVYDDRMEKVFDNNLPIGILDSVKATTIKKQLQADNLIVMFSDGVCDDKNSYDWICNIAWELRYASPDEICEVLLKEAIIKNRGKILDDMSVVVFKLKENL